MEVTRLQHETVGTACAVDLWLEGIWSISENSARTCVFWAQSWRGGTDAPSNLAAFVRCYCLYSEKSVEEGMVQHPTMEPHKHIAIWDHTLPSEEQTHRVAVAVRRSSRAGSLDF